MAAQLEGKPNPQGMWMVFDSMYRWQQEGRYYLCRECFAGLKTDAEMQDGFCARHSTSRHVYTHADALAAMSRRRGRKAEG